MYNSYTPLDVRTKYEGKLPEKNSRDKIEIKAATLINLHYVCYPIDAFVINTNIELGVFYVNFFLFS